MTTGKGQFNNPPQLLQSTHVHTRTFTATHHLYIVLTSFHNNKFHHHRHSTHHNSPWIDIQTQVEFTWNGEWTRPTSHVIVMTKVNVGVDRKIVGGMNGWRDNYSGVIIIINKCPACVVSVRVVVLLANFAQFAIIRFYNIHTWTVCCCCCFVSTTSCRVDKRSRAHLLTVFRGTTGVGSNLNQDEVDYRWVVTYCITYWIASS